MTDSHDPIESAWMALLADWSNEGRHKSFVGVAASLERLPDAAGRYRTQLRDPERGPLASKGLERVLSVAMGTLTPPVRERPKPINLGVPLAALMAALALTVLVSRLTGFRALVSPSVIAGEILIIMLVPWRRLRAFTSSD